MASQYIKGFNGLRALSILSVLVTHLGVGDLLYQLGYFKHRLFLLSLGVTGVHIFFCLSGFLITMLLLKEKSLSGTINIPFFFVRRALKLLPQLFLFLACVALLMYAGYLKQSYWGLLVSVFYCYNFLPVGFTLPELVHMWSLAIEEQFYLVWPFLLSLLPLRKVMVCSLIVIGLCILFMYSIPYLHFYYHGKLHFFKDVFAVEKWTVPSVAPILFGSITAILAEQYPARNSAWLPVFGLSCILSVFLLPDGLLQYYMFLQSIGWSSLIYHLYKNQDQPVIHILEWRLIAYIGKVSYSLYLWQALFLRTGSEGNIWFQQFPYHIICTFVFALLAYHLVEQTFLKWKFKFNVAR